MMCTFMQEYFTEIRFFNCMMQQLIYYVFYEYFTQELENSTATDDGYILHKWFYERFAQKLVLNVKKRVILII